MGLGDDFATGKANELANSAKSKTTAAKENPTDKLLKLAGGAGGKGFGKNGAGAAGSKSGESGSGGKQVKNITLNIAKAIGEVKISTTNMNQVSNTELKQLLTDLIVGAAHDAEIMIANN